MNWNQFDRDTPEEREAEEAREAAELHQDPAVDEIAAIEHRVLEALDRLHDLAEASPEALRTGAEALHNITIVSALNRNALRRRAGLPAMEKRPASMPGSTARLAKPALDNGYHV